MKRQPVADIPVHEVQLENSRKKSKLLHRNMLLPFNGLPVPKELRPEKPPRQKIIEVSDDAYQADSSSSSTELSDEIETPVPQKESQQRRNLQQKQKQKIYSNETADNITEPVPEPVTPQTRTRQQDTDSRDGNSNISSSDSSTYSTSKCLETVRRGARQRQPPLWMRTDQWQLQHQPYTILVDPPWIVNL